MTSRWLGALIACLVYCPAHAQDSDESSESSSSSSVDQEIESLYDESDRSEDAPVVRTEQTRAKPEAKVQSLSDLATLAPFVDVAVIQRRFLPKTGRFEASGGVFNNLNNPFFNALGVSARLAYYLRERYAIEGLVSFASTSSRQVTDDLEKERKISTDNVITSTGFYGVAFKWNPIYGKITWLNKSIVPFDINFNLGLGMTLTSEDEQAPTLHMGTSQVFAWTKSMAFRWDLIWNYYSATATRDNGTKEDLTQSDLFLGLGMSFYFPEATYR